MCANYMPAPANSITTGGECALKPTSGQSPRFRFRQGIKVEFSMIDAVGGIGSATAVVNTFLRELGSTPRSRAPSIVQHVGSVERASPTRGKSELTEEEQREVEKLQRRDREVRAHEASHKAAAGSFARGAPSFEFTAGPDGRRYATEGEVQIDTSEVSGDPQATIAKMRQIRSAALAPAEPSPKDRQVAAEAAAAEGRARTELTRQAREEGEGDDSDGSPIAAGDLSVYEAGSRSRPRSIAGTFIDVIV